MQDVRANVDVEKKNNVLNKKKKSYTSNHMFDLCKLMNWREKYSSREWILFGNYVAHQDLPRSVSNTSLTEEFASQFFQFPFSYHHMQKL